jgi:hypothetical protein
MSGNHAFWLQNPALLYKSKCLWLACWHIYLVWANNVAVLQDGADNLRIAAWPLGWQ